MRDRSFLDWLRDQPCCVSGVDYPDGQRQPAHVFKSINGGGIALKSKDQAAVPLSFEEHHKQSNMSELQYWRDAVMRDNVLLKRMVSALGQQYYQQYLQEKKR